MKSGTTNNSKLKDEGLDFIFNKWFVGFVVSFGVFLLLMTIFNKNDDCFYQELYMEREIDNKVDSMWVNDHSNLLRLDDGRKLNFNRERGGMYQSLEKNDIIKKSKGSLEYLVIKSNGRQIKGEMLFICDD